MRIAIAGYNGFIGSSIVSGGSNNEFIFLSRKLLYGDNEVLANSLENTDAVLNFAWYPIAKRWTGKRKKLIWESRITITQNIVKAIEHCKIKPGVFINSSAIGIYKYDTINTEEDYFFGESTLAGLVSAWENEAEKVHPEVKLKIIRLGLVLGRKGGALPFLLRLFNLGLGGKIGSGKQVYSFIHIQDVVQAVYFLLDNKEEGIFNLTAPEPVTNKVFTETLARQMKRPAFFAVPSFVLNLMLGNAAELITRGQTVLPQKLLNAGYKFTFATINEAIENILTGK